MSFLWTGIVNLGKPKLDVQDNDQVPCNLQDGLFQIGSQAWHILVNANNNLSSFEDDDDKASDCVSSFVEVPTPTEGVSCRDQQHLVMFIPHSASNLSKTDKSRRSRLKVSSYTVFSSKEFRLVNSIIFMN
ncbi:hypothetical protein C0J52_25521 [Blattella germanica]|nr:hypothetical protein C0J52_25521 [Blattella germanica]